MTEAEKKLLQAQHRLEEAQARDRVKERKIPLQLRQLNSLNLWQHLFQNRTLLNEPARSHLSFLNPIPCLRFLQSVLRLQQFLLR